MKRLFFALTMVALIASGAPAFAASAPTSATKAAELRAGLNTLFREHIFLAAAATGAALDGREAEFKAAAGALDGNSVDIANAIGSIYGKDAGEAFLPLWRKHIGFVVDYTVGVATKDKAKSDTAVSELIQYTQDFGAFLQAVREGKAPPVTVRDGSRATIGCLDMLESARTLAPRGIELARTLEIAG